MRAKESASWECKMSSYESKSVSKFSKLMSVSSEIGGGSPCDMLLGF